MIFYNILGLFLCFIWNTSILLGTIYLILEKDWSPWTLVITILFFSNWKEWIPKKPEPEEPKIIL
jgi:hypothetical protein